MQNADARDLLEQYGFNGATAHAFSDSPVFPLQPMAFGRAGAGGREAAVGQFGLVPAWVTDDKGGPKFGRHTYNARTETVFEKPSFREAVRSRRAVVPVSAFYEFPDQETPLRRRLKVRRKDGRPFWLAAIWERHRLYNLESFAILTCTPMDLVAPFHSRSPVLLEDAQLDAWLDPGQHTPEAIRAFLKPASSEVLALDEEPWGKPDPNLDLFR